MSLSGKTKNNSNIHMTESRPFRLAVREIISQSINRSMSLEDLSENLNSGVVLTRANYLSNRGKMSCVPKETSHKQLEHSTPLYRPQINLSNSHLASAIYSVIPQEILYQPLRRPRKSAPPQLGISEDSKYLRAILTPFDPFFTDEPVDEVKIYLTMEKVMVHDLGDPGDLAQMIEYLSRKALDSCTNVPTICKYLYVFSKDPDIGKYFRSAFFSTLENNFNRREELKQREGPSRYRNFIRWFMAAVHHFRNLQYAPFDELLVSLLALADEVSGFEDSEDIPLFCILILRCSYYSTLPQTPGQSRQLVEQCDMAIKRAREIVRTKLMHGNLSAVQVGWLTLVLEATWSKKYFDEGVTAHFEKVLQNFSLVHPKSLNIRLPKDHGREKYLEHIKNFVFLN